VDLQQKWQFEPHLCARICPRSSLAVAGITVDAGVVDSDYRGSVSVLLVNHGDQTQTISQGNRIAQVILQRIETPEVTLTTELDDTVRGTGGFGSTGR
jgi:dUTP pyrophosphatase